MKIVAQTIYVNTTTNQQTAITNCTVCNCQTYYLTQNPVDLVCVNCGNAQPIVVTPVV